MKHNFDEKAADRLSSITNLIRSTIIKLEDVESIETIFQLSTLMSNLQGAQAHLEIALDLCDNIFIEVLNDLEFFLDENKSPLKQDKPIEQDKNQCESCYHGDSSAY